MTNNGSLWRADVGTSSTGLPTESTQEPPGGGRPGGGGANWGDGTAALNYLGADTSLFQKYYTLKSSDQENPWDLLVKLTDVLNNVADEVLLDSISQYLDVDKTLWYLAHETIFSDDDSYVYKGKMDYYIYYEPETNRFIPLEFDGNSALETKNVSWEAFYNEENENYPLMNRLYAIPELRQRYLAHVRSVITELLDNHLSDELIDNYDALIQSAVADDPKNLYSFSEYETTVEEMKEYFVTRKNILESDSEVAEVGLTIPFVKHQVNNIVFASPNNDQEVSVLAGITGTKAVGLVFLYYSTGFVGGFTKTEMFDDGAHNDGSSGDDVYGAVIPGYSGGTYVRYYIEAIADDEASTASYSPLGAEHDVYFYRVNIAEKVASNLVINEISASNSSLAADNEGEYDDWIELFNNSNEAITLTGYYLSDNADDLTKWALPEVSIAAKSYLIIWADGDEDQGPEHANFKLSADGEELFLVTPTKKIADQVFFTSQLSDITYGRFPNGTGAFQSLTATFSSDNQIVSEITNSFSSKNGIDIKLYPNPAKDLIYLELESVTPTTLSLFDLQGRLVLRKVFQESLSLDISQLNSGLYFSRIENKNGVNAQTLIVE